MARLRARSSIIARTTSGSTGGPMPAACERISARWSSARRGAGIGVVASDPKPVEMPYTGSSDSDSLATTWALSAIARRASSASATCAPSRATATTSPGKTPLPVTSIMAAVSFSPRRRDRAFACSAPLVWRSAGRDPEALLGDSLHARLEPPAGIREAVGDPLGLVPLRKAGPAEVEGRSHQLQLTLRVTGAPEGDHPQVVAKLRVHGVVVEGVAQIVERRAEPVPADAVEDVGRVTGDQIGARLLHRLGGAALPERRFRGHVRAPVGEGDHQLAFAPQPCQVRGEPVGKPAPQIGVRDPRRIGARRKLDRVVRDGGEPHARAGCLDDDAPPGLRVGVPSSGDGDPGVAEQPKRLQQGLLLVVERVVVRQPDRSDPDCRKRPKRGWRATKEERLASHALSRLSAGRDAAFEVADREIRRAAELAHLGSPEVLGIGVGQPLGHHATEHHVAEQRDGWAHTRIIARRAPPPLPASRGGACGGRYAAGPVRGGGADVVPSACRYRVTLAASTQATMARKAKKPSGVTAAMPITSPVQPSHRGSATPRRIAIPAAIMKTPTPTVSGMKNSLLRTPGASSVRRNTARSVPAKKTKNSTA